jgi:hypothetical protein
VILSILSCRRGNEFIESELGVVVLFHSAEAIGYLPLGEYQEAVFAVGDGCGDGSGGVGKIDGHVAVDGAGVGGVRAGAAAEGEDLVGRLGEALEGLGGGIDGNGLAEELVGVDAPGPPEELGRGDFNEGDDGEGEE